LRRNKRKRELQKKWKERKKLKAPVRSMALNEEKENGEENEEDNDSETEISRIKSPQRISVKKNKTIVSTLRQKKKIDEELTGQTMALTNPKPKLRSLALNEEEENEEENDEDNDSGTEISRIKSPQRISIKKNKTIVSTLRQKKKIDEELTGQTMALTNPKPKLRSIALNEEENEEDNDSETKISHIKSPQRISVKKNKTIVSTLRQKKKIDEKQTGQTIALTNPKPKLRSIALNEEEENGENEEDNDSETQISRIKSPQRTSVKKNKKIASTLRQEKKIYGELTEQTTPLLNPKLKLKQTKLNFYKFINQTDDGDESSTSHLKSDYKTKSKTFKKLPMTSTPINFTTNKIPSMSSLEIDNITHIESPRQNKLKIKSKKYNKLKNLTNANETNNSRNSNDELNDSSNATLNIVRKNDRLKDSKNINKMYDSSNENKLDDSSNDDTSNDFTINKSKSSKNNNIRKKKNTSLKNKSLQNTSKVLRSMSYADVPKRAKNMKKKKKK